MVHNQNFTAQSTGDSQNHRSRYFGLFNFKAMQKEVWKEIEGYEGLYRVSNFGIIESIKRGKALRQCDQGGGYLIVGLCKNGNRKTKYVHRLVATAFVINLLGKPCVNHNDGNKTNNDSLNLGWCTQLENIQHAHRTGLDNQKGENNDGSKLTNKQVFLIREEVGLTMNKLGEKYNVSGATICRIINRKIWKHI